MRRFFIQLRSWEYWPFNVVYFPVMIYWLYLSIKSRSFFFFTASNPGIENGGMLDEKKSEIFDLIPSEYLPKYKLLKGGCKTEEVLTAMGDLSLNFPIILKPNQGERGWLVRKVDSLLDLQRLLPLYKVDFLLQEFVDYPIELGVFYIRNPSDKKGEVSSVVKKGFLQVTGDGVKSIKELLLNDDRGYLQIDRLEKENPALLKQVPIANVEMPVEFVGNHCKGTSFLNWNDIIDQDLQNSFDKISTQIEGFYFGRFDLKCKSIELLKKGEGFKILELNGAGSEPGHIYQPGYSIFRAYKEIFYHWKKLWEISEENRKRGSKYPSLSEMKDKWMRMKQHRRND